MVHAQEEKQLNQIFIDAYETYTKTKVIYKTTGYDKEYPLGGHWLLNLHELMTIIHEQKDPAVNISVIQKTVMYSLNISNDVIKNKMIDWYFDYFVNHGINFDQFDHSIQESLYSNSDNSVERSGRLVSPDFLRTVIICYELQKYCQFPQERFNVMELGAGFGGLARTFKLFYPNTCLVITDIPETLYFSYIFIRLNFPDAKISYVTNIDDLKGPFGDYDFLFVPTKFIEDFRKKNFQLFYNTASLGEMKNSVIHYWINFVQEKIQCKYFFGLNRFLNTIDPENDQWRLDENACSVSFDAHWDILQWELDPLFARCPYIETLCSRNLEIIAERRNHYRSQEENVEKGKELLERVVLQDWFKKPHVIDKRIHLGAEHWPPRHIRADNDLAPDLTKNGTLYALWRSINLDPNKENLRLMIQYLEILSRKWPFEELYFYNKLYKSITGEGAIKEDLTRQNDKNNGLRRFIAKIFPSGMKRVLKKVYYEFK